MMSRGGQVVLGDGSVGEVEEANGLESGFKGAVNRPCEWLRG